MHEDRARHGQQEAARRQADPRAREHRRRHQANARAPRPNGGGGRKDLGLDSRGKRSDARRNAKLSGRTRRASGSAPQLRDERGELTPESAPGHREIGCKPRGRPGGRARNFGFQRRSHSLKKLRTQRRAALKQAAVLVRAVARHDRDRDAEFKRNGVQGARRRARGGRVAGIVQGTVGGQNVGQLAG